MLRGPGNDQDARPVIPGPFNKSGECFGGWCATADEHQLLLSGGMGKEKQKRDAHIQSRKEETTVFASHKRPAAWIDDESPHILLVNGKTNKRYGKPVAMGLLHQALNSLESRRDSAAEPRVGARLLGANPGIEPTIPFATLKVVAPAVAAELCVY